MEGLLETIGNDSVDTSEERVLMVTKKGLKRRHLRVQPAKDRAGPKKCDRQLGTQQRGGNPKSLLESAVCRLSCALLC